jgi:RNA polymerase sigma-70 factor (ECF subfamily)
VTVNPEAWLAVTAQLGADDDDASPADDEEATGRRPPSVESAADHLLRARAARRDEAALGAIYARHAPAVQRFLRDLVGCPVTAADATQETFVRAFRRLDTLRDQDRLAPWLFGIARNVSLEVRRARRVRARYVVAGDAKLDDIGAASPALTPESELLGREAAEVIARALARLSDERRALLLLRLDHGLAYEEIAAAMSMSLAKVKVEIHRARRILRDELERYEGGQA